MSHKLIVTKFAVALALLAAPAFAQQSQQPAQQQNSDPNVTQCHGTDPDAAIRACTALLQAAGNDTAKQADAYFNRGNAYGAKQQYDQALADYTKVIGLQPNSPLAYNNRAATYELKGDYQKALPDAEKAVSLAMSDKAPAAMQATALETRAEIHEKLNQRDKAVADYRAALKLDPQDQDSKAGLQRLGVSP